MKKYDLVIVGTGLSSAAAIAASLDLGISILIIDANCYERPIIPKIDSLDFSKFHNGKKSYYGSDFSTTVLTEDRVTDGIDKGSYALGGFSNIWGASLDAIDPKIYQDFGIDLSYATNKILESVLDDFSSTNDDQNFDKYYKQLSESQVWKSDASKLAVNKKKCTGCNLCLYGCAESAVFNSYNFISNIVRNKDKFPNIELLNSTFVENFEECDDGVFINCLQNGGKDRLRIESARLFIGAGVFSTAKIFLRSFSSLNQLEIRDSSYFALPVFFLNLISDIDRGIALSSISAKFHDILSYKYALQLYFPSKFTKNEVSYRIQKYGLPKTVFGPVIKRVGILQGYMHSNISNSLVLSKTNSGIMSYEINRNGSFYENELNSKVIDFLNGTGIVPMMKFKIKTATCDGYHFGCSFPHSNDKNVKCTSDILGRPIGLQRTHIIDSSVLPFIPAGSHSLTMMANSYRILRETYA